MTGWREEKPGRGKAGKSPFFDDEGAVEAPGQAQQGVLHVVQQEEGDGDVHLVGGVQAGLGDQTRGDAPQEGHVEVRQRQDSGDLSPDARNEAKPPAAGCGVSRR